MRSKRILLSVILMFSLVLAGCGNTTPKAGEDPEANLSVTKTSFMMGTVVMAKVYGPTRHEAISEILDEIKRLEALMSINIEDSEVSQINANAGIKPVQVSDDTFTVIATALEYAQATDGLFDPTIGPLVELWGIGSKHAKVPTKEEIAKVLPLINYQDVVLNEEEKTVYLKRAGMIIDVGGIAKGFAADRAIEIFKKHQVKSAFVDIGGNVIVHGSKVNGDAWRIGIQDPDQERNEIMAILSLKDQAVVTSGDYERFIIRNGIRYHHILNPKTGYPVDRGLRSASIVGASSFNADALSTSVFLLGAEKGMKLAQEKGFGVMVIKDDHSVIMSPDLQDQMEITSEEYHQ